MIKECSVCNGQVSYEAKVCPHCGHPNQYEWKPVSGFFAVVNTIIGLGLFIFIIFMIIFGVLF
tara:strand:+ start:258 stop:446 length:189 start_codon:yes stop_codon:yes gene_type:complete